MCGIYITNKLYLKEEVESKLQRIKFRGPDNLGITKVNDVTLGHLRLAILDLEARSNQPYQYEHLWITYNGEIYNFESVREELILLGYSFETTSDTEVLIKGYSAWGKDLLPKLNGMFAFAIYDTFKEEVFCARDRLGVKPFYYFWKDGVFEICSQLRPLIDSESTMCEEAISAYLDCGYIPSPLSAIKDVFKLRPGNYLIFDQKRKAKRECTYWDLKDVVIRDISYEQAKTELHELLVDAVKIRMNSDVPIGTFLSGGIDSALVSAIARKQCSSLRTFTIGFDMPEYDESKVAKSFSEILNTEHTEVICKPTDTLDLIERLVQVYDEPFADSSALPTLLLSKVTKQHVTVALSGDGGDESFIGYSHYDLLEKFRKIKKLPYWLRNFVSYFGLFYFSKTKPETIKAILRIRETDTFIWNIFNGFSSLQRNRMKDWTKYYQGYKNWASDVFQRMADLNIKLWLENDSNVKVDRGSMAYSMEIRSPFLDYRIIEFARTLPVEFRYKNGVKKRILKDMLEQYIPREEFDFPKKGFSIPLAIWIREELKAEILNELNDSFLCQVPNLNVKKFKKQLNMHFLAKRDYSFEIWKLYILAKWFKEFKLT